MLLKKHHLNNSQTIQSLLVFIHQFHILALGTFIGSISSRYIIVSYDCHHNLHRISLNFRP